ncbi:MAG: hypothetical protein ACI3VA_12910, partial [Candidatus Limivicinus sp.]
LRQKSKIFDTSLVRGRLWCDAKSKHPGLLNIRGVLRHCVPNKGLHPLRHYSTYPFKAKGVTAKVTPFAYFTVL